MSAPRPDVVLTMTVWTGNPEQLTRTVELFGRAAAGLALEGLAVEITAATPEHDSDEDER